MDRYGLIKGFFHAVEKQKHEEIMKFFSSGAFVHSPVYGKKAASTVYKELIADSTRVKFHVKHIYESKDSSHSMAAWVDFTWELHDGSSIHKEGVYLFEFSPNSEKVDSLHLIFDTKDIPEKLHK